MPTEIIELIDQARQDCAFAYANVELNRNALRVAIANRHPASSYYFSTEPKRHMSSLMFKAHSEGRGVTPAEAAETLKISRQAATVILNETTDAGWTVRRRGRYMYADDMARMYKQAVSDKIASTHLSLTSEDRSSDNDVSEVKHG